MEMATEFFGWCTVMHLGLLAISTVSMILGRRPAVRLHARLFDLDEATLSQAYFRYLANYKIATIVFSLVPYLALKIMAA